MLEQRQIENTRPLHSGGENWLEIIEDCAPNTVYQEPLSDTGATLRCQFTENGLTS